jgi:hypothetical protein
MTTTTTTRKATTTATVPTITRLADGSGVILTDLPFMIPGASTVTPGADGRSNLIMGSRGLGWEHKVMGNVKGWISTQPGAAADAVARLAGFGVAVVDLTSGKATPKATTRKATTRKAAAPAPEQASDLAAKITMALVADGVAPEIIAAAVAAATSKASELAKIATVGVSETPVKIVPTRRQQGKGVTTRKATTRKATTPATSALTSLSGAELVALGTTEAQAEIDRRAARRAAKRAGRG